MNLSQWLLALLILLPVLNASRRRHGHRVPKVVHIEASELRIVDGDTIKAGGQRIRLFGIDAPEMDQTCWDKRKREWPCGVRAKDFLVDFIQDKKLACEVEDVDRYKRLVATCRTEEGSDIAEALVKAGLAVPYTRYTKRYQEHAEDARESNQGIWSGGFEVPEQHRKKKRNKRPKKDDF
eukprot:TRINITY_DN1830_c0_g1_i1.p1 TRINITY_DN1830_c0_g1~~TRINITY_DN1830_c0_g1_i1.p1  ORF type:complete len:180 (+),score=32.09 TRINITY_DN1830_c0_g1_i1:510-1049(+)